MSENLEQGAASLRLELRGGHITVFHGFDGDLLFFGPCVDGGWDKIIAAILAASPDGSGPMNEL